MNDDEFEKFVLLSQVQMLIQSYVERFGSNPYVNMKLDECSVMQLATMRRNLHEVLYSPPSRNR